MRKLLALSGLIVLLDQATKLAVKGFDLFGIHHDGMYIGQSISFLGDFVRLTFIENPGMAFGLDFGVPLLLGLFSIGAAIFLVYLLRRSRDSKIGGFHIALAMILGGAIGNLIDRVFYGVFYGYAHLFRGKVVDFIDVDIPNMNIFGRMFERFYIFNIADAAVSVGIILLLIFYPKQQKKPLREEADGEGEDRSDEVYVGERQSAYDSTGMPYVIPGVMTPNAVDDVPHQGNHSHDSSDSHHRSHSSSHSGSDSASSSHGSSHSHHSDSGGSSGHHHSGGQHSSHDSTSHDSGGSSYDSGSSDSGSWSSD